MSNSQLSFKNIFKDVKLLGKQVKPRDELVLELENYSYDLEPYVRFQNFQSRKLNLNYIKKEFLWYLQGDRFDDSICEHAKIWSGIKNKDGSINSNYGQYIFGLNNQFDVAKNTLFNDKDSRRASIVILDSSHLASDTKDVPCTYSINFRIRENRLNMSVHMRSQDAIFGMANDCPTFSFIQEMMLHSLREKYSSLECGNYHHTADSFHVYERHFNMLDKLVDDSEIYNEIDCPKMSGFQEIECLRNLHCTNYDIPSDYKFTKWLLDNNTKEI